MPIRRYDTLRTGALRLDLPAGARWEERFHVLEFPEPWKGPLTDLAQEGSRRAREETSIPIDTLNRALRALVPDLVSVAASAARGDSRPWLYSAEPVPAGALAPVMHAWARHAFPRADPARVRDVVGDRLRPDDLRWRHEAIDLAAWSTGPNGAARAPARDVYRLLPDALAERLSRPDVACEHGSVVSRFRRAPAAAGGNGAELVSWPPHRLVDVRGETWYYSFTLTLTVQTRAFDPAPVVHCDVGLRRWASRRLRLPGDRETSVYLRSSVPWIRGLRRSRSFQVAPIKWERTPRARRTEGDPPGTITWGSKLAPILDELAGVLQAPLPTPADLCLDPTVGLQSEADGAVAAVVYGPGLNYDHRVGTGVMPKDRLALLGWVARTLDGTARLAELLPRVPYAVGRPRRARAAGTGAADGPETAVSREALDARAALARATGGRLTLDILWQTDEMRQALEHTVVDSLGLARVPAAAAGEHGRRWDVPGLGLTIRTGALGTFGAELAPDPTNRNRDDRLRRAVRERCDLVAATMPAVAGAAAALVELQGREHFEDDREADPKFALRRGLAEAERVSQFVTPRGDREAAERAAYRVEGAWRDLLRQLGFQWSAPRITLKGAVLPARLQYVGVWLIRQQRGSSPTRVRQQVPVAVRLTTDDPEVLATAPGLDAWVPYRQALQRVARLQPFGGVARDRAQVVRFVQQVVEDAQAWGDTLLLTHAQNLRGPWDWLANKDLERDRIRFGAAPAVGIERYPGLRHVRVRTSEQRETPECFGQAGDAIGFTAGLWRMGGEGRVFASTTRKPHTAKRVSAYLSRVESWRSATRAYDPAPDAQAFNPQLVELTVAAIQPGDEAWAWAALAHELRSAASHHEEPLTLPLPLHLARQMEEYVLPLPEWEPSTGE